MSTDDTRGTARPRITPRGQGSRAFTTGEREPAPLRPGQVHCPACGRAVSVTATGRVRAHQDSRVSCPGSGQPTRRDRVKLETLPPVVMPYAGRHVWSGKGQPAVSGLPGNPEQDMSDSPEPDIPDTDMSDSPQTPKTDKPGHREPPPHHHPPHRTDTHRRNPAMTTPPNTQTAPKANTDSPTRHLKIPDSVWIPALEKAATEGPEGTSGAAVVRSLLRKYVAGEITL